MCAYFVGDTVRLIGTDAIINALIQMIRMTTDPDAKCHSRPAKGDSAFVQDDMKYLQDGQYLHDQSILATLMMGEWLSAQWRNFSMLHNIYPGFLLYEQEPGLLRNFHGKINDDQQRFSNMPSGWLVDLLC